MELLIRQAYTGLPQQMIKHATQPLFVMTLLHKLEQAGDGIVPEA